MAKYFKHKLEKLLVINKIVTIHYSKLNKNFYFGGEKHNFWEMVFVEKGSVIISTREKGDVNLEQGQAVFHKPNQFHSLKANGVDEPKIFIITFDCSSEAVNFFIDKIINIDKKYFYLIYSIAEESKKTFDIHRFDPYLTKLELVKNPLLGGEQTIKNCLEILLINLIRSVLEENGGKNLFLKKDEIDSKLIKDVYDFLTDNVNKKISIDDVCKAVNYSKAYVFREFKKHTGKGVIEYFNILKIEKAKSLIKNSNYSVKEISLMLSFDTPNYFCKTFKKYTSFTPTQYKNFNGI